MNLRPYQQKAITQLQDKFKEGFKKIVLVVSTGGGKSLCANVPVLMYNGSIKMSQEIKEGDILMGDDSTPRNVLRTSVGEEECYDIIPNKGMSWSCNESHIMTLKKYKGKGTFNIVDINLKEYINFSNHQKHIHKLIRTSVDFKEKELLIDPYFLGIWLGDGEEKQITIHKPDKEIHDYCIEFAKNNNYECEVKFPKDKCPYVFFPKRSNLNSILVENLFNKYKLFYNKHIPNDYLINSRENRLKLLAGLLDTDGYYHHGFYEIACKDDNLAKQIVFLAQTLGYFAKIRIAEKGIKLLNFKGTYNIINISGDFYDLPCKIKRKIPQRRLINKDVMATAFNVKPIGIQKYYGIEIDGNRRFLLGDCTITHNTVIAAKMMHMTSSRGKRILFLAHRSELIKQCHNKLKEFGVQSGIIMAGTKEERLHKVQVASIQTLSRRDKPHADLVIIDECHNSLSKEYLNVLRYYEEKGAYFIGLTATPFRTNKRQGLNEFYEDFAYPITISELINQKFLVPTVVYNSSAIVTKKIKKSKGDFDDKELMVAFDKNDVYKNLIANIQAHIKDKKTIIFCCNVEHSKKTTEALIEKGYKAVHCDGTFTKEERDKVVNDFKNNKYQFLLNVNIFTEGTDIPDIEAVILNMATTSRIKYMQSVGRGLRIFPNKTECVLIDMADNVLRHGFVEQDLEISLEPQTTKESNGVAPVKVCKNCGRVVSAQTKVCIECKYVFPINKSKKEVKEEIFQKLERLDIEVLKYKNYPSSKWNEIPTELLKPFAKLKGFKTGWVNHQMALRKEGKKVVRILNYDSQDYYKQANWLQKAYYDKILIDAHTYLFIKETDSEIIFEYIKNKNEGLF